MKIAIITSTGGHLYQIMLMKPWWSQFDRFFVTFNKPDSNFFLKKEKVYFGYFPENKNIFNALRHLFLAYEIFLKEKPNLVFSIGAGIAPPFFLVAKLLRIKMIFIEPYDFIFSPSLSGKLIYQLGGDFFIQHEELRKKMKRARYVGSII